jgi:hypothetical protein
MKKIILLASLAFSLNAFAQIPTNGLVGYYPFSGNSNDLSGNNNNGTVSGAVMTTDRFGNANSAYSFNGNSEIRIPNSSSLANFTDKYTMSAWVDISAFNSDGLFPIIDKNQLCAPTSGTTPFLFSGSNNTTNGYHIQNIDCGVQTQLGRANEASNLNTWTHVVAVYNGTDIKIYVNDILKFTNPSTGNISASTGDLTIGRATFGNGHYAIGSIDDLRIYNEALSPTDVTALYNENVCYQLITVTDTLLINTTITGFNPVTFQNTIKIYPNPTNDHITIDNGNIANMTGYQIKITNSLSQQVFQSNITQQQFYVDLSTWTGNGIYFVHIIDGQGNTIDIKKIVLQ